MIEESGKNEEELNQASPEENELVENEEIENVDIEVDEIEDELEKESNSENEELQKYKDEVMRLHAEMDNLRKRNSREMDNLRKYALDKFSKSLIPVADSFDKALEVASKDELEITAEQMVEGTVMTQKVFLKVLADNGVELINPVNEKFNPEFHEAMAQVPNPDLDPNTVVDVFQKGYVLNGRLIRPAMVVVSK